jgi:cobalt-zinc-cadmium efflux system outer membrane protein
LEVNLARATRGRAERRLARAEAAAVEARAALALAVGLEPGSLPEPTGELPAPREVTTPLPELLRRAGERRADLTAFRHRREAASARVQLARSRRLPDLELGAFYEREEGTDEIVGVGVGVAIPIFNRNQGGVAEAEATRDRLDQERSALQLAVAEEVVTAHARVRSATRAAELLRGEVLGSLEESLELLRRAFEAGKIGATEVLLFRRELVESRREHVEALAEAWLGRVALDLAAGRVDGCPIEEETP